MILLWESNLVEQHVRTMPCRKGDHIMVAISRVWVIENRFCDWSITIPAHLDGVTMNSYCCRLSTTNYHRASRIHGGWCWAWRTCNLKIRKALFNWQFFENHHRLHEQGDLVFVVFVVVPCCNLLTSGNVPFARKRDALDWVCFCHVVEVLESWDMTNTYLEFLEDLFVLFWIFAKQQ